jgi:hypothetical protein
MILISYHVLAIRMTGVDEMSPQQEQRASCRGKLHARNRWSHLVLGVHFEHRGPYSESSLAWYVARQRLRGT